MSRKITRRDFLKAGAIGAASTMLVGCENPRPWVRLEPYVKPPEEQVAGQATWYASTCRMCPAGCGIIVRIMNGRALKIEGNPEHPLNKGKLCPRGQAGLQLLYNPDRLKGPVTQAKRGTGQYAATTWDNAIKDLGNRLQGAGNGVAIWANSTISGHLYDLFSRYNQASGGPGIIVYDQYTALTGYPVLTSVGKAQTNAAVLPAYDLGHADVVFSFGADLFGTGTSTTRYGIEYGNLRSYIKGQRGYWVQFEPKMTTTGVKADEWIPIKPGYEGLVAQAILRLIADKNLGPSDWAGRAGSLAGQVDVNAVAQAADVPAATLEHLARVFAAASAPVAIPGEGLMGMPNASEMVGAVQALNTVAGNTGKPGGMIQPTGQPVQGVAQAAVSNFSDIQKLISQMQSGAIKVLLVYGGNPVYELPAKIGFKEALAKVPSVISFAPIADETASWADAVLPDLTYLESWGYEVVSPDFGIPTINSQQPVVPPVFDGRSTADVMLNALKGSAAAGSLNVTNEVALIKDTVTKLSGGSLGSGSADELWARFLQHGGWWQTSQATGAANPPPATTPTAMSVGQPQYAGNEGDYPYFLRIYLSPLLGDGRGANIPWLQGSPDPVSTMSWQTWVEINPDTANKLGIKDGDMLKVTSPNGEIQGAAYLMRGIRPDTISIPTGRGHTAYGQFATNKGSNPMDLVGNQGTATGENLVFGNIRVKVSKAGKRIRLATFEYKPGVDTGIINTDLPGR